MASLGESAKLVKLLNLPVALDEMGERVSTQRQRKGGVEADMEETVQYH